MRMYCEKIDEVMLIIKSIEVRDHKFPTTICGIHRLFFTAVPMWHWLTFAAKRSELIVSLVQDSLGETFTNIKVLALPPSACWSKKVSLEFLKGMCCSLEDRAIMTLPKLDKERLICFVSVKRSPVAPDSFSRSDPAKSTMYNTPEPIKNQKSKIKNQNLQVL